VIEALLSKDPWFAPKRFGYGSGLPTAWQGWVLSAVFIILIAGFAWAIESGRLYLGLSGIMPGTLAFLWLAIRHTPGGWRWRSGSGDV